MITLEMDRIIVDSRLQIRSQMDEEKIEEYATLMKERNANFPPLVVGFLCGSIEAKQGNAFLIDGFHRYEAAKRQNAKRIDVYCKDYASLDEMYIYALRHNIVHGLPLTREDRTAAIATIILKKPSATLKELARLCGVSKSTVDRIRKELSHLGKLKLDGTTTGEDGKQRKQKYAERKEPEPTHEPESRADAEPETQPLPEGKATYCAAGCGMPMWSCFQEKYVAHDGKWFCSEKCAQRYREKNPEPEAEREAVMEPEAELRAGSGPEDDEPETEMEGGNEAEGEITREPEPEPEPDPGTNPKMVRCAICSRKATLEAATFHASSWIYDADSFDSEKMTWTRWFCCAHCEALRDDLLTINERLAEHLAEELVHHLYHDPFGYRDPENVQAILTRALELYREKAKGIIKK